MIPMRRLCIAFFSAVLALLALAASPAPALAAPGDSHCVWTHLPQAFRDKLIADYQVDRAKAFEGIGDEVFNTAARACGLTRITGAVQKATQGELLMRVSAAALKARYGVDEDALRAAWLSFPEADRRRATPLFTTGAISQASEEDRVFLRTFPEGVLARLKLPPEAMLDVAIWIAGYCYLDQYET